MNWELTEQKMYNDYIVISSKQLNRPFKLRKNFDGFDEEKLKLIKKICHFFKENPHLRKDIFFKAPYIVYENQKQLLPLKFFVSMKAMKLYRSYFDLLKQDLDNDVSLQELKMNLKFILGFCKQKGIPINDYFFFKSKGNQVNDYLIHIKNRKITLESCFFKKSMISILHKDISDVDLQSLYLGGQDIKESYYNVSTTKKYSQVLRLFKNKYKVK